MTIIKELQKHIDEELGDSEKYIKCAISERELHKDVADVYYLLSQEEMAHAERLHKVVVEKIEEYKRTEGEPPAEMMFLYNYLHEREIEKMKDIKVMQSMYK